MMLKYHPDRDKSPDPIALAYVAMVYIKRYMPEARRILDIGCGHGKTMRVLREHGFDVYGVDLRSREELGIGRDMKFYQADARALEFSDNNFDFVIEGNLILDMVELQGLSRQETEKVEMEAHRVLRHGGLLCATPWTHFVRGEYVTICDDGMFPLQRKK